MAYTYVGTLDACGCSYAYRTLLGDEPMPEFELALYRCRSDEDVRLLLENIINFKRSGSGITTVELLGRMGDTLLFKIPRASMGADMYIEIRTKEE